MFGVGVIYEEGLAVPIDFKTAREWYVRAAASNFGEANKAIEHLNIIDRK